MKTKRERSSNFSETEIRLLINSILEFKEIIENKLTDSVSLKDKAQAWENIETMFNASSGGARRCIKTLKLKYEGIKKALRKKVGEQKKQMYLTGGGPPIDVKFTDVDEQVLSILKLNVEGLPARADNDQIQPSDDKENIPQNIKVIPEIAPIDNIFSTILIDADIITVDNSNNINKDTTANEEEMENEPSTSSTKWTKWTPKQLRSKKQGVLYTNRKEKENTTTKFNQLADAKNELVKIQMDCLKSESINKVLQGKNELIKQQEEIDHKRLESDLRIKILERNLEEAELIIKIKKEQHDSQMKLLAMELKCKEIELNAKSTK